MIEKDDGRDVPTGAGGGSPVPALTIALIGPWDIRVHGGPLPPLRSRKGRSLLALLVLQKGRAVERDWLAGTLWPESSGSQALYNLRRNLTDVRDVLGPEAHRIQTSTPHSLRVDLTGAPVDVVSFDEAMARGDRASLEMAVALYRGPLLDDCSEEWVLPERVQREQAYLQALERLAAEASARGKLEAAARYLRRVIATDPLCETAQRALMQSLAAAGDFAAATLLYREFRLLLQRELNMAPGPETSALFRQLRTQARARAGIRPAAVVPRPAKAGGESAPQELPSTLGSSFVLGRSSLAVRPPCHLPRPVSTFVGRDREALEIETSIAAARLVTLTGPGGVGKTRLAIRVAEDVLEEFPDGAWFVDLAALADPSLVPQTVGTVLGASEQPDRPLIETLRLFLRSKQLLLVVDNCEHLLEACAHLVAALLAGCPDLGVLATSRQPLGISGEIAWRVPPLSLPDPENGAAVEWGGSSAGGRRPPQPPSTVTHLPSALSQYEAVRLFVERGTAADRSFKLTESNAPLVVDICRRLDGIPLAIELAAARLKALSMDHVSARLSGSFQMLTGGSRASLPRQQTLRATLDWSYDLLEEPERTLLRRLSVFAGGFTLEAAEAVCAGARVSGCLPVQPDDSPAAAAITRPAVDPLNARPLDELRTADILDLLASLVDKSLVQHRAQGSGNRYRLLKTVRQYSRERLLEAGEAEDLEWRHGAWFLALAEQVEPELRTRPQTQSLARLESEHDNFRSALEGTLGRGEGEAALRLAGSLWRLFYMHAHLTEGRLWLEKALALSREGWPAARAKALHGVAVLCHEQNEFARACAAGEESLVLLRQLGDQQAIADALDQLGHIVNARGDDARSLALFEESLALRREIDDGAGVAASLNALGYMARFHGDYERAAALSGESLRLRRELGDLWGMAYSLEFLTQVAIERGDNEQAAALLQESLALRQQLGDQRGVAASLANRGQLAINEADWDTALTFFEQSLHLWQELGNLTGAAGVLGGMARVALARAEHAQAAALYRRALALLQDAAPGPGMISCLEGLAYVATAEGQAHRAARLLGAAEAAREAFATPLQPRRREAHERVVTAARAALGETAFAAAWAEGRAMTLEDAAAGALETASTAG